jgi:hypothetical protein
MLSRAAKLVESNPTVPLTGIGFPVLFVTSTSLLTVTGPVIVVEPVLASILFKRLLIL